MYIYILRPVMDEVLSEEMVKKTINEMGGNIFLGGNFPGGGGGFSRGEFDGWEFSGLEISWGESS